jgi:hypothetical protein
MAVFMTAMQGISDNRAIAAGLPAQAASPLPDLLMDWAPHWIPMVLADLLLNSFIGLSVACFGLRWLWQRKRDGPQTAHFTNLRLARRFLWMLATAYFLRSFSLLSTTMPPSDPRCQYRQRAWNEIPLMAIEIMSKTGNTCSDKIFSGHSSMATLLGLFWLATLYGRRNGPLQTASSSQAIVPSVSSRSATGFASNSRFNLLPVTEPSTLLSIGAARLSLWRKLAMVLVALWVGAIYAACVLCRNHYSIDIVVAALVCSGIYLTYSLSVRVAELAKISCPSPIAYRPLVFVEDPEAGLLPFGAGNANNTLSAVCSPVSMQEITLQSEKPASPAPVKASASPNTHSASFSQLPPPWRVFLRTIAWMDGSDLR